MHRLCSFACPHITPKHVFGQIMPQGRLKINGKLVGVQQKLHLPQLFRYRTWIGRESCFIARRFAKYPRKSGCGQVTHHPPYPFDTIDNILIRNFVGLARGGVEFAKLSGGFAPALVILEGFGFCGYTICLLCAKVRFQLLHEGLGFRKLLLQVCQFGLVTSLKILGLLMPFLVYFSNAGLEVSSPIVLLLFNPILYQF